MTTWRHSKAYSRLGVDQYLVRLGDSVGLGLLDGAVDGLGSGAPGEWVLPPPAGVVSKGPLLLESSLGLAARNVPPQECRVAARPPLAWKLA